MSVLCQTLLSAYKHLFFHDRDLRRCQFERAGGEASGFANGQEVNIFWSAATSPPKLFLAALQTPSAFFGKEWDEMGKGQVLSNLAPSFNVWMETTQFLLRWDDCLLAGLGKTHLHHAFGRNFDLLACSWVKAHARLAIGNDELADTWKHERPNFLSLGDR